MATTRVAALLLCAALATACGAQGAELEEINPKAFYPEGPLWRDGKLFYAEMPRHRVMVWDGSNNTTFWHSKGCGPTSVAPAPEGGLYVLCHYSDELVMLDAAGRELRRTARSDEGLPLYNPNDSEADGQGGLWFTSAGDFSASAPITGRVFHLSADGSIRMAAEGLHYANGITLSADRRFLFVSEHLEHRVLRYAIAADGSLSDKQVFFNLDQIVEPPAFSFSLTGPDGLAFDGDGRLYVAQYGAGRVLVLSAEGRLLELIKLPAAYITNVAWRPDGRLLYITGSEENTGRVMPGKVWQLAR